MRLRLFTVEAVALVALLVGLGAPAHAAGSGLTFGGCYSVSGHGGACGANSLLAGASSVTVSPDGKNTYVASYASDAVVVFNRNAATGALVYASCISETGNGGNCTDGFLLDGVSSIAISPDGKHAYAASQNSDAVVVFNRNATTGALSLASCVSETGNELVCTDGYALDGVQSVTVSPDGQNVYATATISDAVTVFVRNPTTGALAPAGCVSETGTSGTCTARTGLDGVRSVSVSADGKNAYTAASNSDTVIAFSRNSTTGALSFANCIAGTASALCPAPSAPLDAVRSVVVSLDGKNAYAASYFSDAVVVFSRDTTTGRLTRAGCISETGAGGCADGVALDGAWSITVSSDDENVYATAADSGAAVAFSRNTTTGALTPAGCISDTGTSGNCATGTALGGATSIAVSSDGNNAYATSDSSDSLVTFNRRTEVFRFWSQRFNNAHFFTASQAEADNIRATDSNWTYEGVAFKVRDASAGSCAFGSPVYRFYSANFASHFYTIIETEKNTVMTDPNWSFEGVAYCAFPTQLSGTTALYRFWSPVFHKHFFTANAAEANHLRTTDPNWSYEGIAYYVLP